jgi:hypothetical protein
VRDPGQAAGGGSTTGFSLETCRISDLQVPVHDADSLSVRIVALRRADSCGSCGAALGVGERAAWDSAARRVTCLSCFDSPSSAASAADEAKPTRPAPALERGTAGRSVTREAQRRSERHHKQQEERVAADRQWRSQVKAEHPLAGRLVAAVTPKVQARPAPQHVKAWVTGAPGEQKVGEALEAIRGIVVLHDRRKPRSRSNIDHIAVTPAGVWVIDAKVRADKRLEFRNNGGLFGRDERLIVGGRDETKLVDDIAWQVQTVHEACADLIGDTVVRPALCFVDARVGWLDRRPWAVRNVVVCWRAVLPDLLLRPGPLDERRMIEIAKRIANQLPPA